MTAFAGRTKKPRETRGAFSCFAPGGYLGGYGCRVRVRSGRDRHDLRTTPGRESVVETVAPLTSFIGIEREENDGWDFGRRTDRRQSAAAHGRNPASSLLKGEPGWIPSSASSVSRRSSTQNDPAFPDGGRPVRARRNPLTFASRAALLIQPCRSSRDI
jgi:hypothetical protein